MSVIDKLDAALKLLPGAQKPGTQHWQLKSALGVAKLRIEHLEAQLAATETMRDRVAMQLLPRIVQDCTGLPPGKGLPLIRVAYQLADEVMLVRVEEPSAPAEAPREYEVGDQFQLRGRTVTIDAVYPDALGVRQYSWAFLGGGGEGDYSAAEIAEMLARDAQRRAFRA